MNLNNGQKFNRSTLEFLDLLESQNIGRIQQYHDGETLFHQGGIIERIFVVRQGSVKAYSTSVEGKIQTYGIYRAGRILGATAYFLWGEHKLSAEAIGNAQVRIVSLAEFEQLLFCDPHFSFALIRELSRIIDVLVDRITSLSFLDVRERLRHSLIGLADEYGAATESGVKIDLDITHEEIAELIVADRSTVTSYLNELRRQGYLWREGNRLVMVPPEHIRILDHLRLAVSDSDEKLAGQLVKRALEVNVELPKILDSLTDGIKLVENRCQKGTCSMADILSASEAVRKTLLVIEDMLKLRQETSELHGTAIIGIAPGDEHFLGKDMVVALFKAAGFNVIDLGEHATAHLFIEATRKYKPDIIALSTLTSQSIQGVREVLEELKKAGLRPGVKVMLGGGAISEKAAKQMGADGFSNRAGDAVGLAWELIES